MENTKEETRAIRRSKQKLEEKFYIVDILHEDLEILLNLVERQQREIESAKEALKYQCKIAEQRNQLLTENEELKDRCESTLLELVKANKKIEDSISKEAIREKLKEYAGLKEMYLRAYKEQVKPLRELLEE